MAHVETLERRMLLSANVLTAKYDNQNTGQDPTESILTPQNVNASTFGKLYSTPVSGQVFAQPLYVAGVNITTGSSQGVHDVVYVATEMDAVYAVDADTGVILWQDSFIDAAAGITPVHVTDVAALGIQPSQGITGTPVIDPSNHTMYLDAETRNVINGQVHILHTLHALDIQNGAEASSAPVVIADAVATDAQESAFLPVSGPTIPGTGAGSVDGKLQFNATYQLQRPGLTLSNGNIYIGYGSNSDTGPYHGWILGFSESNLALDAVFCDTPNGGLGGIWQAGSKVAVDSSGNLFVSIGNGVFDTKLNAEGFPSLGDYGDSVVKLSSDPTSTAVNPNINGWGLKVTDYFSPYNEAELNAGDFDLGSAGPLLLPPSAGSAAHPNLLVAGGKEGRLYLIDQDNMGKYDPQNDNCVQEIVNAANGIVSGEAYANGVIYVVGAYGDSAKMYPISDGQIAPTPSSLSTHFYGYPGSSPTISSDGTSNGIVWTTDKFADELFAYSAGNLASELYDSSQAPNGRDAVGGEPTQFASVTVASGKVYVSTLGGEMAVYGLLPPPTTAPTAPASLQIDQGTRGQLKLNWANTSINQSSVTIQQSDDGGMTFNTIATLAGYPTSYAATGLADSSAYSFRVSASNSVGVSGWSNIAVGTTIAGPQGSNIDFSDGFASIGTVLKLNGSAQVSGTDLQLTDGEQAQTSSVFSTAPVQISVFNTSFTFQLVNPEADGFTFAIQGNGDNALGSGGLGLGYVGIAKSAAVAFSLYNDAGTADATGFFANGAQPTAATSTDLTPTLIDLHADDLMTATASYNGATLTVIIRDDTRNISETQNYVEDIPALIGSNKGYVGFTAATGTLSAIQNIQTWSFVPGQPAPTNVAATAGSSNVIKLSWQEEATTQSGIVVEQSSDGTDFAPVGVAGTLATSFNVAGLEPSTQYWFRLQAANAQSSSGYSTVVSATTLSGATTAPLDFSTGFSNAGPQLVFNQNHYSGYPGAIVGSALNLTNGQEKEDSTIYAIKTVDVGAFKTNFSFQIINGFADGFTFIMQGNGTNAGGLAGAIGGGLGFVGIPDSVAVKFNIFNHMSDGSNSTGLLTDGVQNETASGSINLTPSGIKLASGHVIDVAMTYDGTMLEVTETDTQTQATATQSYAVNIPAIIGGTKAHVGFTGGSGGLTAVQNILTWTFTPTATAPSSLTATPVSASEIDLAWTDNSTTQSGYIVERSTDDIVFAPIATLGNVSTFADTTFNGGTNYFYEVLATNAAGQSLPSNVVSAISPTPPATPSDPQATKITTTELDLSWVNNADNADNYLILRKDGENGDLNLVATLPATATTYDDTKLTPGQRYDYHIEAVNVSGHNDFAGIAVSTICLPPAQLTAAGGVGIITISWKASFGAVSYIIYRGVASGLESNQPLFTGVIGTSYVDLGVPPNTTYYYHVAAVDSSGQSVQSAETFATSSKMPAFYVKDVTPAGGGSLLPGESITATFNTDVSETDTVSGSTFTLTPVGGSTPILANVSYNSSTFVATLTPAAPLVPGQQYVAALSPLIADNNDDFLTGGYSWTFTDDAPTLTGPTRLTINENASVHFFGANLITVSDPSAGDEGIDQLTIAADSGYVKLLSFGHLQRISGNGTSMLTVRGTVAALSALSTLRFYPAANFAGTASINLTLSDPTTTATTKASILVTVKSLKPMVTVKGPASIAEGQPITFTAVAMDPLGRKLSFSWNFTGTGPYSQAFGANPTISWARLEELGLGNGPRRFYVRVLVTDGAYKTVSAPMAVEITAVAPTAILQNNGPVAAGSTALISFTGQFDPSAWETQQGFRYTYDFDDNNMGEIVDSTRPTAVVPAKYLMTPGLHVVSATITDRGGKHTTYTTSIRVL